MLNTPNSSPQFRCLAECRLRGRLIVAFVWIFGLVLLTRTVLAEESFKDYPASADPMLIQDVVPATAFVMVGDQITFAAVFSNSPGFLFQWQKISDGKARDIDGATNTSLTLTNLRPADTASYRIKAINLTNLDAATYTSAGFLSVDYVPAATDNLVTVVAAQTGLGGMTSFTPTWFVTTNNNLVAGKPPKHSSGNFSLEATGRSVSSLTDGRDNALRVITNQGLKTSSTNYVTCGSALGAGSSVTYRLPNSTNGYDLTNIMVYGGWADGNRDQQAYTVYYSTVAASAFFLRLGTVNFTPSDPANAQSATRVSLLPANGVLASNVAAVKFDFSNPSSKNGYSGYSQIVISGVPSSAPPVKFTPPRNEATYALNGLDFLGSWIWDTNTYDKQTCYFWKTFDIPSGKRISNAMLILTADNEYTLYLDGRLIGHMAEWREYWEYDVTMLMTPGRHVLAVKAYNSYSHAGLIFGLHVDFEDNDSLEVKSDSSWQVVPAGTRHWETRTTPLDSFRPVMVLGEFGMVPWNESTEVQKDGPPLQPIHIAFWQTGWFQITLATLSGLVFLAALVLLAQLALHQKERSLLQHERTRIAMDVHDDIGSRITQLVLNGEVAKKNLPDDSLVRVRLGRICDDARKALASIDEILWALNPRLDTLQDFADYICDYAHKYLAPSAIECVFEVDAGMQSVEADLPLRRSLLMAIKEALANIVKHSGATQLELRIQRQRQDVVVVIQDNGKGFDLATLQSGRNGLNNMTRRMRQLGGNCQISSLPGKGCRLKFCVPLKRAHRFLFK